jgi:hypothetical protein
LTILNPYTISYTQWQNGNAPRHKLNVEDPAHQKQENTNTMVEVNLRHECALRVITHARIRGGTNDLQTARERSDAIVDEMIVGAGGENIVNAIERRRGIMIGNDMKIRSRRNRERMYVVHRPDSCLC